MWGSAVQVCSGLLVIGGLAQLARAPALQAGGHRFESDILHFEKRIGEANPEPLFSDAASHEIFDILTHKTVS